MSFVLFYDPWGYCAWHEFPAQWVPDVENAYHFETLADALAVAFENWPEMPIKVRETSGRRD